MKPVHSLLAAAGLILAMPHSAWAHASLSASSPAQGSVVSAPRLLSLAFDTPMTPATTTVSVVMTAMPGMANHGEMMIRNYTHSWSSDNRKLTLTLKKPLHAGDYDLRWQSTGADGHKVAGKVTFSIK